MPKKLVSSFAIFALLLSLAALVFAQAGSESSVKGSLSGVVLDPSDAVVSGAKVTISGPTGDKSMQTDPEGKFLFQVLTPGFYSVKIEKEGFKATDVKQAEVQTGRNSSISVKLELGASSTVVEVSGAAVAVETLSKTGLDATLGGTSTGAGAESGSAGAAASGASAIGVSNSATRGARTPFETATVSAGAIERAILGLSGWASIRGSSGAGCAGIA